MRKYSLMSALEIWKWSRGLIPSDLAGVRTWEALSYNFCRVSGQCLSGCGPELCGVRKVEGGPPQKLWVCYLCKALVLYRTPGLPLSWLGLVFWLGMSVYPSHPGPDGHAGMACNSRLCPYVCVSWHPAGIMISVSYLSVCMFFRG